MHRQWLRCIIAGHWRQRFLLEAISMRLCANGLMLALVGWKSYRRMCAPLLFLFLMLPLPGRIHDAVMLPLQSLCARMSATVLETVGVPVASQAVRPQRVDEDYEQVRRTNGSFGIAAGRDRLSQSQDSKRSPEARRRPG